MKPISPVIPGHPEVETVYAKDQPQYLQLPAVQAHDEYETVITRWQPTFKERLRILLGGSVWLSQLTFGRPLQPIKVEAVCPVKIEPGPYQPL